jgi:hypothetical protein
MKDKSTFTILILTSSVALLLIGILSYGIYEMRSKNQKTFVLLQEADKIATEDLLYQSIRSVRSSIREDLSQFDEVVLTEEKVVPLIERIENAGRTLGLETKIASVSLLKVEGNLPALPTDNPKKVRLIIETKGSRGNSMDFLSALESLPHRVIVDEASLTLEEGGWRTRTSLSVYAF